MKPSNLVAKIPKANDLEAALAFQLSTTAVPMAVRQYRFSDRRFRFDFAWPDRRVAVEVDGGAWVGGRHVRGAGFHSDCVKLSTAAALGWRCLRVDGEMIDSGQALELIEQALSVVPPK